MSALGATSLVTLPGYGGRHRKAKDHLGWEEPLLGPVELQVRHGKGPSQTNLKLMESSVYVAQRA